MIPHPLAQGMEDAMQTRRLGPSDLEVSALSLGTMGYGAAEERGGLVGADKVARRPV